MESLINNTCISDLESFSKALIMVIFHINERFSDFYSFPSLLPF